MEKINNLQEATNYVYNKLKEVNPDVDRNDVFDTILDEMMESSEYIMLDEDIRFLEDNADDQTAIDDYLQAKIPDYHELLTDIVNDMINDEDILEEE